MKPDYEVLELQLSGTAQLLAQERRNHAATAQALSDAEIGGRNAFVMAAAGHEYCEVAQGRPFDPAAYVEVFNAIIAAHDATTPSPEQAYVVVSKERLARLEAIEQAAKECRDAAPSWAKSNETPVGHLLMVLEGEA